MATVTKTYTSDAVVGSKVPLFNIPVEADAYNQNQAEPDTIDFEILAKGAGMSVGVTLGVGKECLVTFSSGLIFNIASGVACVPYPRQISAQTITLAGMASNPRFDLIVVDYGGNIKARSGVESTNPIFPTLNEGDVVLAAVYVDHASTLAANRITDKRILIGAVASGMTTTQRDSLDRMDATSGRMIYNTSTFQWQVQTGGIPSIPNWISLGNGSLTGNSISGQDLVFHSNEFDDGSFIFKYKDTTSGVGYNIQTEVGSGPFQGRVGYQDASSGAFHFINLFGLAEGGRTAFSLNTSYDPLVTTYYSNTATITGATGSGPVTITASGHGLTTGETVLIEGTSGAANLNGTWTVTGNSGITFTIGAPADATGYSSGGVSHQVNDGDTTFNGTTASPQSGRTGFNLESHGRTDTGHTPINHISWYSTYMTFTDKTTITSSIDGDDTVIPVADLSVLSAGKLYTICSSSTQLGRDKLEAEGETIFIIKKDAPSGAGNITVRRAYMNTPASSHSSGDHLWLSDISIPPANRFMQAAFGVDADALNGAGLNMKWISDMEIPNNFALYFSAGTLYYPFESRDTIAGMRYGGTPNVIELLPVLTGKKPGGGDIPSTALRINGQVGEHAANLEGNISWNQTLHKIRIHNGTEWYSPVVDHGTTLYNTNVMTANAYIGSLLPSGNRETGTSTGSNSGTTLIQTGKSWTTNQWANYVLYISGGTGVGQARIIGSNSSNTLTLNTSWYTIPDNTSTYTITPQGPILLYGSNTFAAGSNTQFMAETSTVVIDANSWSYKFFNLAGTVKWRQQGSGFGSFGAYNNQSKIVNDVNGKITGTATSGASTTLTDSGASWTTNQWTGYTVSITSGTGSGQSRIVSSNTATALTVPAWTTNPNNTSVYEIHGNFSAGFVFSDSGNVSLDTFFGATSSQYASFISNVTFSTENTPSGADLTKGSGFLISEINGFDSRFNTNSSNSKIIVTERRGVKVRSHNYVAGTSTLYTQIGLDIDALTNATLSVGVRNASQTYFTPASAQNITSASNSINHTSTYVNITGNASYTLTSTPSITNHTTANTITNNGELVIITNTDSDDTVTLQDATASGISTELSLPVPKRSLGPKDSIVLVRNASLSKWVEIAYSSPRMAISQSRTAIPYPLQPTTGGTTSQTFTSVYTKAYVGLVTLDAPISVKSIAFNLTNKDSGIGTYRIGFAVFSEDGVTRFINANFDWVPNSSSTGINTLSVSPSVVLPMGNYYFFVAGLLNYMNTPGIACWTMENTLNAVTSEPTMSGTYTITTSTMPTSITLANITATNNCTPYLRLVGDAV